MRILLVNKYYWLKGGSERVVFDLQRGYEDAGHETAVFSTQSPHNRSTSGAEAFAPEVDWSRGGPLARVRLAARVVYSRDAKARIRRLVQEIRPDVAHLHNFHHQLSPSIVDGLREEGVPCVYTLHDYKVICPNYLLYTGGATCERCRGGRFFQAIRHRCVRNSIAASAVACVEMTVHRARRTLERGVGAFVSPSRFLATKLAEFGFDEQRVRVVPNGIDLSEFSVTTSPGRGFLYAGRLSREKGLGTLIRAIALVPTAHLTIVGEGPEERSLRTLAGGVAPGRIEFTGRLPREELLQRMRGMRAVVLPSEWYENAPIAALEALASGVPVIASALGGNPEIVRPDETGFLFGAGDDRTLAARLETLHDDADLARRLGRRGREVAEAEYSLELQVRRMLEILAEVSACASR